MFLFYNSDLVVDVIKKLREGSEYCGLLGCIVCTYVFKILDGAFHDIKK